MKVQMNLKLSILCVAAALTYSCSPKLQLNEKKYQQYEITGNVAKDSAILSFYAPYKHKLDSIMSDVVGFSEVEMEKNRPESTLGNFFADAMFDSAKEKGIDCDVTYSNTGGLRNPIPKGNVKRMNVFELMPFENAITVVKFKGIDMQAFFDFIASEGGDPISGARFVIDSQTKKAKNITINGLPIDLSKVYTVVTSDYMANGGDGGVIFNKAVERKDYNYTLRDAILDYMAKVKKTGKTLNPVIDGRIIIQ